MSDAVPPPVKPSRNAIEGAASGLVLGLGTGGLFMFQFGVANLALVYPVIGLFILGIGWRVFRRTPRDRAFLIAFRVSFIAAVISSIAAVILL